MSRTSLLVFVVLLGVAGCGGSSVDDPESARCDEPSTTLGTVRVVGDHREQGVHFTCNGATLGGTLYLPAKHAGRRAAVVFVHGSGETARLGYGNLVEPFLRSGIAFFSYDKRGTGESEGECCPGDQGHFNLLAADVDGAVNALRRSPELDGKRIGLFGISQAGWVAPLAAVRSHGRIAFLTLVTAAATSTGEEALYSDLAGEESGGSDLSKAEIDRRVADAKPSGFDPRPVLGQLTVPSLWLFGSDDISVPNDASLRVLQRLRDEGKDVTTVVYPHAGHSFVDVPAVAPTAMPNLVRWVESHS